MLRSKWARTGLGAAFLCGLVLAVEPAAAQSPLAKGEIGKHIQIGRLRCAVAPSVGFVVGSRQEMQCELRTDGIPGRLSGLYKGVIKRFGIDLGVTGAGILIWEVFSLTKNAGPAISRANMSGPRPTLHSRSASAPTCSSEVPIARSLCIRVRWKA
jgi:hypothetical protein